MVWVKVQVLDHLQMTDLSAKLHIFDYKNQGDMEEREAWGQEIKSIYTTMEAEVNKQINH